MILLLRKEGCGGIPQHGNYLIWGIVDGNLPCGNSAQANSRMKKSRYTKQYARVLEVLRAVRHESGLTQTEVGRGFGTHASFVSKVELGERRIDIVELAEFCRLYGVGLTDFLTRAGLE